MDLAFHLSFCSRLYETTIYRCQAVGICADDQKYIWNEFYQVDDRSSNKYRGAGLGLTLVHDLLILLEGDSLLQSEPGQGTRVEFSVPVTLA